MPPKKILTPAHQAKLLAGKVVAKQRRLDIRDAQESKADTIEVINSINSDINVQLDAIKDDIITIRKLVVVMERGVLHDDWGRVFSSAAAIHAFAISIARRVETCSAQANVTNDILSAMRVK
jgi:hypothetical protein